MYTKINKRSKEEKGVRISYFLKSPLEINCKGLLDTNRSIVVIYNDGSKDDYRGGYGFGGNLYSNETNRKNEGCSIEIVTSDIVYSSKAMNENPIIQTIGGIEMADLTPRAKIKTREWDFEYETRITAIFRCTSRRDFDPPKEILVPIDFDKFNCKITLNPWNTIEFKDKVNKVCRRYLKNYTIPIIESKLKGNLKQRDW